MNSNVTYRYICSDKSINGFDLVMKSYLNQTQFILETNMFDTDVNNVSKENERIREVIGDAGVYIIERTNVKSGYSWRPRSELDTKGNEIFRWNMKPGEQLIWNFKIGTGYFDQCTKKRTYLGASKEITFGDKQYSTIAFLDSLIFGPGEYAVYNSQNTIYAKGIGIYQYQQISDGDSITFTLDQIIVPKN